MQNPAYEQVQDRKVKAPQSEGSRFQSERLFYGREPNDVKAEPGKQRPEAARRRN